MRPFEFYNPTKVIFAKGVEPLGACVRAYGKRALFIYGQGSIKRTGLYDKVIASLKNANIEIIEYPGVRPNPVLSHAREGVKIVKNSKVEVIVAVGGGSVIDEAKAIAAGSVTDIDIWEFFEFTAPIKNALPIVTVLTICGSGSEMNNGMVLTNEEKKAKFGLKADPLYPKVSILDPKITFTVPKDQTAYGAIDAFSHVFEVYMARVDFDTPLQKGFMETIMKTIIKRAPEAVENPEDYNARADLMWASSLALCGITFSGAGPLALPCHVIEHSLSAFYDIPHGMGLAIVMPGWMKYVKKEKDKPILEFCKEIFGSHNIDEGIEKFEGWMRSIGAPVRLSEADIPKEDIPSLAENAYQLAVKWGLGDIYTPSVIEDILKLCI